MFSAGTLVKTKYGDKAIEDIKVGDLVYAEDPDTGEKGLKKVVRTFVHEKKEIVHIKVNGEEITTTDEHPFYVPEKGWTVAAELRAGDQLKLLNGEIVIIEQIQHELLENPIFVYNFEVEDFHTYYVSESGILVHNACSAVTKGINKLDDASKWLAKGDADNIVYYGVKNGENVYTGITKQSLSKRLYQHNYVGKGFDDLIPIADGLTRNQARAVETYLIDFGSANAMNSYRSISPTKGIYDDAMKWAKDYIMRNGIPL